MGDLSVFLSYASQYAKPFNEISGVVTELQNALACAARVFSLLDEDDRVPDKGKRRRALPKGTIDLKDVCFRYVPDRPLIEGFNLHVKPGQRIAIVGPTGCGKTTMINLLMRFYDVNSGAIFVDGTDIRDATRHSLRKSFGMVLQDTAAEKPARFATTSPTAAPTHRKRTLSPPRRPPTRTASSAACPMATTRLSPKTAAISRRDRSSCSALPA